MKCNVANGRNGCPCYNNNLTGNCILYVNSFSKAKEIKSCYWRLKENRLERAFKRDCKNSCFKMTWLSEQWEKEKHIV